MTPVAPFSRPVLGLLCALGLAGCDQIFHKNFRQEIQEGEKKARAGDFPGAIQRYESVLDGSPRSAEVHYRLALLYADKVKSPVDALHHFGRYLALAPEGPYAKEAKQYKAEGERKVVAEFTKGNAITQAEALRLKNENLKLIETLATERERHKNTVSQLAAGVKKGEEQRKPIPEGARTYTVQPGDNFGKISMKFFNSRGNARRIQEANFMPMAGTPTIKPGMVLVIPEGKVVKP